MYKIILVFFLCIGFNSFAQLGIIDNNTTATPPYTGQQKLSSDGNKVYFRDKTGSSKEIISGNNAYGNPSWITSIGLSKVIGLQDSLNKKVEKITGKGLSSNDYVDEDKEKLLGLVSGQVFKGNWDASTNTPTLTTTPSTNGDYYLVSVSGTSSITGSSTTMVAGGRIISNGTAWVYQAPTDSKIYTDIRTTIRGIYSYNASNTIDAGISDAIKNIHFEVRDAYKNDQLAVRLLGYNASSSGLIIQIYDNTLSSVIYTIKLSSDGSKPATTKRYTSHLPNEYYIDITVDWTAFSGGLTQSTELSVIIAQSLYDSNRLSYNQFGTGVKQFSYNGIDESIAYSIKNIYLEVRDAYKSDVLSVRLLGYNASSSGLIIQIYDNTLSSVIYTIKLSSDGSKPSDERRYTVHLENEYYIDLTVDWRDFTGGLIQSTAYSVVINQSLYSQNRLAINQFSNGISGYSTNGTDERLAYAIKDLYFEYSTGGNFAVRQIGWDGTSVVLSLRNITNTTNYNITLEEAGSKPSGIKYYVINRPNEFYLFFVVDWNSFSTQSITTSTYTATIRTYPYTASRNNDLGNVDYNNELIQLSSAKSYTNEILDLSKIPIETGTISSGADAVNVLRLRTRYTLKVKAGSTLNYKLAANYKMIVQQVQTNETPKNYILITDTGVVSDSGVITLNVITQEIRIAFLKYASDGTTNISINPIEVTSSNFSLTSDWVNIEPVNQATKFTDNQLMNQFIKEIYIEGLDKTKQYIISHVRRGASGIWRFYINRKDTNTNVYVFSSNTNDFNESQIFDKIVSGVRVRAVLDWSALPANYSLLNPTKQVTLSDKIFDMKYCPILSNYYADKNQVNTKLLTDRQVAAYDNNYSSNAALPHKNTIVAFMNGVYNEKLKDSTIVTYETLSEPKNGSIGLKIGDKFYEFCQEVDALVYDENSVINVREVNISTKTLLSKTRIFGYGDLANGVAMTRIPYVYSAAQVADSTIRIFVRVRVAAGEYYGYIDFNVFTKAYTAFASMILNGGTFNNATYYAYIRDNVNYTLINGSFVDPNVGLSFSRHTVKYGSYYYSLVGSVVGTNPYAGTYHTVVRSTDCIAWETFYTFSEYRNGQDDGDIYLKGNLLYFQLRQSWGTLGTIVGTLNLDNKVITSQQIIKASTHRGEFFEYDSKLYLMTNFNESRQYSVLNRLDYDATHLALEITPVLTLENYNANWSIIPYSGKVYVFFGVQVWELNPDHYNTSICETLYNLLK